MDRVFEPGPGRGAPHMTLGRSFIFLRPKRLLCKAELPWHHPEGICKDSASDSLHVRVSGARYPLR